jgi:hypothetical protein
MPQDDTFFFDDAATVEHRSTQSVESKNLETPVPLHNLKQYRAKNYKLPPPTELRGLN